MRKADNRHHICAICHGEFDIRALTPGSAVRSQIADLIRVAHPDWAATDNICQDDLTKFRSSYVQSLLASEKGELTTLEEAVVNSLREQQLLSTNIDAQFEREWSQGERLADRIATFGGSWTFLVSFGIFIAIWIVINSLALAGRPIDPYPYILLNLMLSCLAAIQAPIIMMSQNRQEAKDRQRSLHDYQINLKAELEIRHLHEKMDHLISNQWERLVEIQQLQLDLLAERRRDP
jgi:uncharacterized membrane protein